MSGGSYDYFYFKLEEFAHSIPEKDSPRRLALKSLLLLVAQAAHDIEWVDSGDYGTDGENEAIDKVLAVLGTTPELLRKAAAYNKILLLAQEGK